MKEWRQIGNTHRCIKCGDGIKKKMQRMDFEEDATSNWLCITIVLFCFKLTWDSWLTLVLSYLIWYLTIRIIILRFEHEVTVRSLNCNVIYLNFFILTLVFSTKHSQVWLVLRTVISYRFYLSTLFCSYFLNDSIMLLTHVQFWNLSK